MILRPFISILVFVTAVSGQTTPEDKAQFQSWLTPEKCAGSDPDALYLKHIETDGLRWDSEQARDKFHEVYAEVLASRTDQQHPEAAKFRKSLLGAFKQTFEFIRTANGNTSTAHQMTRLPAELEWMINRGFKSRFDNGVSGEFTLDDIRNLARIYQQSQTRFRNGEDLSHIQADILEPALDQLKIAEQSMTKEAAIYFRAKIVSMFAQYIGR
jgi:hypothetical protein